MNPFRHFGRKASTYTGQHKRKTRAGYASSGVRIYHWYMALRASDRMVTRLRASTSVKRNIFVV